MGFNFSAVTALLGGYPDRQTAVDEQDRRRRGRDRNHFQGVDAGEASSHDTPRLAEPVAERSPVALNGIGRALDALIAAEETRRRNLPSLKDGDQADARLSSALKASLPRAQLQPTTEGAPPAATPEPPKRNWDEIRSLIEALATAERPHEQAKAEIPLDDILPDDEPVEFHPWQPKVRQG
ncbi:hypothetical protein E3C22_22865 [Jiella endophytica]|uniref:Uncharacterized protein n=1 Tax=Jiella endophytica TaxID=2558362 RepID=A0A4Y8R9B3_9HYPH|nr:hypothetical protein [Jiella endophytica]TFF17977.1 hypothetical protein E3C22_22865 [Jiella endophytica]